MSEQDGGVRVVHLFGIDLTYYTPDIEVQPSREHVTTIAVPFPLDHPWLNVFAEVRLPGAGEYQVGVEVVDDDGALVDAGTRDLVRIPDDLADPAEARISYSTRISALVFGGPGLYWARLVLDGEPIDRIPIRLRDAAA